MKTVKRYKTVLLLTLLFSSQAIFAQNDFGIFSSIDGFLQALRQNAGKVFALLFLGAAMFNIGKITGSERDYKGFFVQTFLWVLGISVVGGIFAYLLTVQF